MKTEGKTALPQLKRKSKLSSKFFVYAYSIEFLKQKSSRTEATNYNYSADSVRVLLEKHFQGHRYLEVVNAIDSDEASQSEAAVFLESAHAHQSRDGVRQLAMSSAHVDPAPYQLLHGTGATVSIVREHKPAIAVRDSSVYLQCNQQV